MGSRCSVNLFIRRPKLGEVIKIESILAPDAQVINAYLYKYPAFKAAFVPRPSGI